MTNPPKNNDAMPKEIYVAKPSMLDKRDSSYSGLYNSKPDDGYIQYPYRYTLTEDQQTEGDDMDGSASIAYEDGYQVANKEWRQKIYKNGGDEIIAELRKHYNAEFLASKFAAPAAEKQPLDARPSDDGVPWENFPSYLLDKCEGETITEEFLQTAVAEMMKLPRYAVKIPPLPENQIRGDIDRLQSILDTVPMPEARCGVDHLLQRIRNASGHLAPDLASVKEALEGADLSKCPRCGGDADNGHDRCYPPNPYLCTVCAKSVEGK